MTLTKEKGNPNCKLFALVPVAEEECHRRKETAFEKAKQNSADDKRAKRVNETSAEADDTPAEGDCWDHAVELQAFDQD